MSSKVGQSQQQGRRTPLSLTGGKHGHHQQQQQQQNKNSNLSKIQEMKAEAATAANTAAKNGNNNAAKHVAETNNAQHKEHNNKKSAQQQNGNENGNSDDDVVLVVDKPGKDEAKNGGTANGHNKSNKNGAAKTETAKEKDNKETAAEVIKEKPKEKSKEKQQTETKAATKEQAAATENATKPVETAKTANDKKQQTSNSDMQKPATPTKALERGTATPPASNRSTPTKSPRIAAAAAAAAAANKSANGVQESPAKEMPPLVVADTSPTKKVAEINPTATSTPGKVITTRRGAKADAQKKDEKKETVASNNSSGSSGSPIQSTIPRAYSAISGRRSIRPIEDFTPQMYNSQFRESYRRINTELDVTGNTNTSMNVTVGSEIPNNSSFLSFSLFGGRGRKREHTPPRTMAQAKSQSAVELTTNETTPPKRARLDMQGIFTAMSSPLTLLRTRFSKTTLESSTPAKVKGEEVVVGDDDVQNVSGVSIEEVAVCNESQNATVEEAQNVTVGKEAAEAEKSTPNKKSTPSKSKKADDSGDIAEKANNSKDAAAAAMDVDSDIQIKETPIIAAVGDPKAKQRGCLLM